MNGQLMEEPRILVDNGFYFGYGVFETMLVKGGKPILLKEHLERLHDGIKQLKIAQVVTYEEVMEALKLLKAEGKVFKITVSESNLLFSTRDNPYTAANYERGAKLICANYVKSSLAPSTQIKSLNYLDNYIANRDAKLSGHTDAYFINERAEMTECTTANLFFIREGKLHTPSVRCGLLNGITRQWILQKWHECEIVEGTYTLSDFLTSEGVFMTNSVFGIMKVVKIDEYVLPDHPFIQKISQLYNV